MIPFHVMITYDIIIWYINISLILLENDNVFIYNNIILYNIIIIYKIFKKLIKKLIKFINYIKSTTSIIISKKI